MNGNGNKKSINLTILFAIMIIGYLLYLSTLTVTNLESNASLYIYLLSLLGVLLGIFVLTTWKIKTGMYFSLYTIFMLFFFLFNYGQCLMWAIGIHLEDEIGKEVLYSGWGAPSKTDIFKTQAYVLICILMFHCGALFTPSSQKRKREEKNKIFIDKVSLNILFKVCFYVSLVVFPITIFSTFQDLQIAQLHGYRALYYSEYARSGSTLSNIVTTMFFPCIVGMLLGSEFNKKVRYYIYTVFILFITINLLAGDRGSWVYTLVILIWISHFCFKKINFKKFLLYLLLSLLGIYVIDSIVSLRNVGINYENFKQSFSFENSALVETIFEMGSSMKPTIVLNKYGWDIWPYSNSYFLAALTMVTNKVLVLFNIPFNTIGSWFSQSYLGISYGAGFSIVAEALLNFGPYFSPFIIFLMGFCISKLIYIDRYNNYKISPLRFFFAITTLESIIPLNRNYLHYQLKEWFFGVFLLFIIIFFCQLFSKRKTHSSVNDNNERWWLGN